jgi:hypothetical protein
MGMSRIGAPTATSGMVWRIALGVLMLGCLPGMSHAQVRDRNARIPAAGELWFEFAPEFVSWNRQYAEDSPVAEDGQREPLFVDYDGRITERLFPGVVPLLLLVNRDADALGFDPLTADEASMGGLDFQTIDVEMRRVPLGLQFGIGGFAAFEVIAPLVRTEVETTFVFDSAAANLVPAETALADPSAFSAELDAAQFQLQAMVDGGFLTPEEVVVAEQLLADSEAFQSALGARIAGEEYLFTSSSQAGNQMTAYYSGFASDFQSFGISTPAFGLPGAVVGENLDTYFTREPLSGQPLGSTTRGWSIGELELGVRFKILDTFGWPQRPAPPPPTEDTGEELLAGADTVAAEAPEGAGQGAELDTVSVELPIEDEVGGIRFRTSVGARYRLPLSEPDQEPYLVPDVFLQQPIGDGQADLELELYQDIGFGRRLLVVAGATFGIQLQDELLHRISASDHPYALGSQEVTMTRDLGDYLHIVVSPRLVLAEALSLAVEYSFWSKEDDVYEVTEGDLDASPLTLETSQTRHTLGIGAYYRTTRLHAAGRSSLPIELAFLWETAIGGTGGQTPVATFVTASARMPFKLF